MGVVSNDADMSLVGYMAGMVMGFLNDHSLPCSAKCKMINMVHGAEKGVHEAAGVLKETSDVGIRKCSLSFGAGSSKCSDYSSDKDCEMESLPEIVLANAESLSSGETEM
jgi:hypothetical protein